MPTDPPQMIDRFELIEQCGQGGMGSVYRARDTVIHRTVALKIIELGGGTEADIETVKARVLREARAAGKLSHENIVTVHDAGEWEDHAWIVMEFIEGVVFDPSKATEAEIVRLLKQSAAALDYAHSRGIIHRDVKPSNLLIGHDGVVKLADFGIAKLVASDQLTRSGSLLGTPTYMSPEQLKEKDVGAASDQFSLAVVAYEALARTKPFEAESISGLLVKILQEEPAPASSHNPLLSPAVDAVLARALAKEAAKRFPNCAGFVDALSSALAARQSSEPPPIEHKVSRRNLIVAAAAGVLLCAVGWFAVGGGNAEPELAPVFQQPPVSAPEPTVVAVEPVRPQQQTEAQAETLVTAQPPVQTPIRASPPTPAASSYAPSGPPASIVWSGTLGSGETLTISAGQPDHGSLSRSWPQGPVRVEVSPSAIAILEAPSETNNWSLLRLRNSDAARTLVILRYIPIERQTQ